jgi:TusA-related sulfurtransferase
MQSDKSLRIRTGGDEKGPSTGGPFQKIDLLGIKCPFNYVKTKLKLETMASGDSLEVLLDQGEPEQNVPRSIQNDGHKVLSMGKENGHFKMVIEKA